MRKPLVPQFHRINALLAQFDAGKLTEQELSGHLFWCDMFNLLWRLA